MRRYYLPFVFLLILQATSCTNKTTATKNYDKQLEKQLTLNPGFKTGDVRRYGLFPSDFDPGSAQPPIKKNNWDGIVKLASTGLEIYFPEGFYNRNLILKNVSGVSMCLDDAVFSSALQIIDAENIRIKGKLTTYSLAEIVRSNKVHIDTLWVLDAPEKNIVGMHSGGCRILYNSSNIKIKC
jgi:hypothetical protein